MRDKISEQRVALLHPKIRDEVKILIEQAEETLGKFIAIRVVQGLRTFAEQDALYAQGRTKPGNIVTNSRAGASFHNYGTAIDFALLYDKDHDGTFETLSWNLMEDMNKDGIKDWDQVVSVFEHNNYLWGGSFHSIKDNPHLEKITGLGWRQFLAKYNGKEFIPGTQYVNY